MNLAASAAPSAAPSGDTAAAAALQGALEAAGHGCAVHWLAETGSTNSDLLAQVRAGRGTVQCLVAGHQSAGRGRRSRNWHDRAPDGADAALLCSTAWPLPRGCELAGLSLAVGVWLAQALRALGLRDPALKWPNDLLLGSRKLAGILVEVADAPDARWAVIGIGLNLRAPQGLEQATSLEQAGVAAGRWQVLGALLPRLLSGLQGFAQHGFSPWMDAWNSLHAWAGAPVQVLGEDGAPRLRGEALGVDEHGFLWLRTAQGRERVASGDVSLRMQQD
ncbi:biotin--[acetyl-CoA-carboxylase] ligase [Thiomonas sp.]|uniref:biotin--[acetyl-CoA-carboxylase] ligase n=1 Tax=Thiomonas sp. TaxID=2047785 RepID=UPI002614FB1A|nr:biotin--[acetyl-CoA-carboxylase] ligase [Thiomonas sp.]